MQNGFYKSPEYRKADKAARRVREKFMGQAKADYAKRIEKESVQAARIENFSSRESEVLEKFRANRPVPFWKRLLGFSS